MTKLSVNINKVATLRNARGGNVPNVVKVALDCESFGADGITVHPRPDERHIRRSDVYDLRPLLRTEFNIEGYPSPEFIDLVLKVKPHQVTLVPDDPSQITSNSGWDTKVNFDFLTEVLDVSLDDLVNYDRENSNDLGLGVPPKGKHVFGITKVGEKGQIVIPAKARKIFDIQPGDNLILLGDESQGIAIIKEKRLVEILNGNE